MAPDAVTHATRVPVDAAWARELEDFVRARIAESPGPDALESQPQGIFAAGYWRDLALLRWAAGDSSGDVRAALRRSTEYTLAAFAMRPAPESREPWAADEPLDQSLTNSRRGLEAMELALAAGAPDLARALAPLVWDPPGASYLGPTSVVCTPADQRLAYALRDLLLGRAATSESVRALPDDDLPFDETQRARAWCLFALAAGDRHAFTVAHHALHAVHLARVRDAGALRSLDDLLDVPALAGAALACERFGPSAAPRADPYLPVALACGAET